MSPELPADPDRAESHHPAERARLERDLRQVVARLGAQFPGEQIRLLADTAIAGAAGADYLLQFDEIAVRLLLLPAPAGRPTLAPEQLPRFVHVLAANPATLALVLVWPTPALAALPASLQRLRSLQAAPERLPALLERARPLGEVLASLVERLLRRWDRALEPLESIAGEPLDLRQAFARALELAIDAERGRAYRVAERRAAADYFPLAAERDIVLAALDAALAGAGADAVAAQLAPPAPGPPP
jgi:hypothetical protein